MRKQGAGEPPSVRSRHLLITTHTRTLWPQGAKAVKANGSAHTMQMSSMAAAVQLKLG